MEIPKCKIVVIGNAGVGKTSLIKRYVNNYFSEHYKVTIGVDFALKVLTLNGNKVHLQLWDIAGQERFGSMTRIYYKAAKAAIIVFDVTMDDSFDAVAKWKNDLITQIQSYGRSATDIPILLLGNKVDLIDEDRENEWMERMEAYIQQENQLGESRFIGCSLTSAKDKTNIEESIENLVKSMDLVEEEVKGDTINPQPVTNKGCCKS
eukprot:TRINITY_DN13528_c0_g1_i1.p1 TRINITY_DN13528_c0_g1~~TRINITY_DN13528_c0_g1_i1.p1  ORF type:complete len:207 (+),score=45.39 TRINITY_DN13528_c0_g1_i1:29-649(+)